MGLDTSHYFLFMVINTWCERVWSSGSFSFHTSWLMLLCCLLNKSIIAFIIHCCCHRWRNTFVYVRKLYYNRKYYEVLTAYHVYTSVKSDDGSYGIFQFLKLKLVTFIYITKVNYNVYYMVITICRLIILEIHSIEKKITTYCNNVVQKSVCNSDITWRELLPYILY